VSNCEWDEAKETLEHVKRMHPGATVRRVKHPTNCRAAWGIIFTYYFSREGGKGEVESTIDGRPDYTAAVICEKFIALEFKGAAP